jgi:hypothetical protein
MTAVAGEVRFYVDESALGLGKTLTAARKDVIHVGHPLIPECPYGTVDDVWMPAIAARGLIAMAAISTFGPGLLSGTRFGTMAFVYSGSVENRTNPLGTGSAGSFATGTVWSRLLLPDPMVPGFIW